MAPLAGFIPAGNKMDRAQNKVIKKNEARIRQLEGNFENKYAHATLNNTGVGVAGVLITLDDLTQNDLTNGRSGIKIAPRRLDWRMILESEIADPFNTMRVMIVQSKIGALILGDFPTAYALLTPEQKTRYTVLSDKTYMLNNDHSGPASDPLSTTRYSFHSGSVKVRRKITYLDAATVFSETGALYAYFVSDSASPNHPDVEVWRSHLTFKDA